MKTAQEIFSQTVEHLRKQGCRAERIGDDGDAICLYSTADNKKCAVGIHILPEHYRAELEGCCIGEYEIVLALQKSGVDAEEHFYLLRDLQGIHDRQAPAEWESEFQRVAKKHSLTYTAPAV